MTPAQQVALAVALDGLRESGLDNPDIAREVLRAVEPNRDNLLATRVAVVVRERIDHELRERFLPLGGVMTGALLAFSDAVDWVGRLDLTPIIERCAGPFSPPEASTATSTPHLPGETVTHGSYSTCIDCGGVNDGDATGCFICNCGPPEDETSPDGYAPGEARRTQFDP